MGNPSNTILYHIIIRPTLNIFLKTLHTSEKPPKLVAKILATKFGFVPAQTDNSPAGNLGVVVGSNDPWSCRLASPSMGSWINSPPPSATHASVKWVNIGSDNGLSPGRRQAVIWTNAYILSIRTQGIFFNEILFEIEIFSFKKMHLNMLSAKWRPFCPGGDELTQLESYLIFRKMIPLQKLWRGIVLT